MTTPLLRVDTSVADTNKHADLTTPAAAGNRARSLSQSVLPALRISVSPNVEKSPVEAKKNIEPPGSSRARNESRKLLAHILSQLQNRPMPPSSLQAMPNLVAPAEKGLGAVVQSVRVAVKHRRTKSEGKTLKGMQADDSDSDLEDDALFSTDTTFDLMSQLKDVLIISAAQKWDILNDSAMLDPYAKSRDSVRNRRSAGRRFSNDSRTSSASAMGQRSTTHLLSQCIATLASVIAEDCRFQVASPRPSRPPNALQSISLDVAQFLIHSHQHDPGVLSQVAFAVIPAFHTFDPVMHVRLLAFFDEGLIGPIIDDLNRLRSSYNDMSTGTPFGDSSQDEPPMVSIMVEQADDSSLSLDADPAWRRWSKSGAAADFATRSTSAPGQDLAVYQLSAFIPALLASLLEKVEITGASHLPVIYRFHRLFGRLIEAKPDVYLDVLSVVAYHTPKARYSALSVLSSYWPRSFGHLTIAKAFPPISYSACLNRATQGTVYGRRVQENPHAHQFVPWRFDTQTLPALFEGMSRGDCHACSRTIAGFGLLCPFCMTAVHFDCYDYPDGSQFSQYSVADEGDRQRIAVYRFCHVAPHRREAQTAAITKGQHTFRPVNMFSLTLCLLCRRPLWGCIMQGLRCMSCKQYVHSSCSQQATSTLPRCRSVAVDDSSVMIDWSLLRRSFNNHYHDLIIDQDEIARRTYEEVSVYYSILWLQLNILQHGIALGSVVVAKDGHPTSPTSEFPLNEFELHHAVAMYENHLKSNELPVSAALADYLLENRLQASEVSLLFDWRVLTFMTSVIKAPTVDPNLTTQNAANFLAVDRPDVLTGSTAESELSSFSYEIFSLAHIRDQLGDQLHLYAEPAAELALMHLSHLGFFQRLDNQPVLFDDAFDDRNAPCSSPLPVGLESSPDVEMLVSAIEACLADLDLSVNESGLLLLVRRFWPDGFMTDYALRRLCAAVISWVVSEDHNLAIMLRDYVAKGRSLPGVRAGSETPTWPSHAQMRTSATSSTNGGDYVAARRTLLEKHAATWLLALHDLNLDSYATMLYDVLLDIAEESEVVDDYFLGKESDERHMKRQHSIADRLLGMIVKLNHLSVVFTAFDDLFKLWLRRALSLSLDLEPIPSLGRLFNREIETVQRFSSVVEPRKSATDMSDLAASTALRVLVDTATASYEGYQETIHCLCLCVRSGVDISVQTFLQLASLAVEFSADFRMCSLLINAVMWSTWLRSVGRQELQSLVIRIHTHLAEPVLSALATRENTGDIITFLRHSLAICLLLYGCERQNIIDSGLIGESEIGGLPSRRKLHARNQTMTDTVVINTLFMNLLSKYVDIDIEEISCLVARFLNAFVNEAPFIESFEVDNFILQNANVLSTCAWQFYDVQQPDISSTRPALLLRVLVVDPNPLHALLDSAFATDNSWEIRLQAALRCFRVILDVTNPTFNVEGRQWRASVVIVFYRFFTCLWADDREEVRSAVDTWCHTLLQAHFDAISVCWQDVLATSPISDRAHLASFLIQLQPHFPKWQFLPWAIVTETMIENDFMQRDNDELAGDHLAMYGLSSEGPTHRNAHIDPDAVRLKVSLLSLALRTLSSGIVIDRTSLLKVKDQYVRLLGFQSVWMVPTTTGRGFHIRFADLGPIPDSALICLNDLMLVLDSAQSYDVSPSMIGGPFSEDDTTTPLLIGSVFVDVVIELFVSTEDLAAFPFITSKSVLKSLIIVLYKHDFDSRPLRHLQANLRKAVRRALDFVLKDINYELRQLALTICQIFIKRWSTMAGNFPIDAIELVLKLMATLDHEHNADDVLVEQSKTFLTAILSIFASGGILNALFKRTLPMDVFVALRHALTPSGKASRAGVMQIGFKDVLLRDTMSKSLDNDPDSFQAVVDNICTYVEVVHHTGYSTEMLQAVGIWLTGVARRAAEWPQGTINPSPLIILACTLIQYHKAQSRDLLGYMETLLRATLTRCAISTASLTRVVEITSQLYRKATASVHGTDVPLVNPILLVLLETISDGVYMRARVQGATLASLFETMSATIAAGASNPKAVVLTNEQVNKLSVDAISFFCYDASLGRDNVSFDALLAAANLLLDIAHYQTGAIRIWQRSATLRAWNILVLAALQSRHSRSASLVLDLFTPFASAYCNSLIGYQRIGGPYQTAQYDPVHTDVSIAYASIKLWLLLAQHVAAQKQRSASAFGEGTQQGGSGVSETILMSKMIWNELWPPFERVVAVLEAETHAGNVTPLALTVWTSVADLLLFLRQSRSVVLDASSELTILERLRGVMRGESKLMRVTRSMNEPLPDLPFEYFVTQVVRELRAEEKLFVAHRQDTVPDRIRRIAS
ncbi:hypothetical protein DAEQUDRAFT_712938 [Daedalea quercina L-15889]|uniref:Phorbol-ester/DAG-type domain-containing protein n=1 Tax=Daedalea quercina L-15889 TaxID=1314783 RepID=A0A165P416_9APHY|nr:hypothetical protein DAEQUDRAFT_712938 [Daedalea quercina L-15889]